MNFKRTILENGLRLITVPMKDSPAATVLVMVEAGSKYETKDISGLSHFLEHMCFKGTTKRPKAIDISRELDSIGAHYNAFTAHEYTGYYAKVHPQHIDKALDVLSDMYLDPVFDQKEIDKEKGVIIEEINMYEDMPHRHVHDLFSHLLYGDQPAGWNIAGTREIVASMNRDHFIAYRNKHYVADSTIVIVAGNFDEEKVLARVQELFTVPASPKEGKVPVKEAQTQPQIFVQQKKTDQVHMVLGVRTFDTHHKDVPALKVLNAILGGGMSSRLFQKLRDEMGVGYYVRSGTDEFTDHGVLAVSTGVDTRRVVEVIQAILGEFTKLRDERVSDEELKKAKDYITGSLYLELETSDAIAGFYGTQDVLREKEIKTPDQISLGIQKVTAEDVLRVAKHIFVNTGLNIALVGSCDEEAIRSTFSL